MSKRKLNTKARHHERLNQTEIFWRNLARFALDIGRAKSE